jgi:hypothetical protein
VEENVTTINTDEKKEESCDAWLVDEEKWMEVVK